MATKPLCRVEYFETEARESWRGAIFVGENIGKIPGFIEAIRRSGINLLS